jgi:hypothetical protein
VLGYGFLHLVAMAINVLWGYVHFQLLAKLWTHKFPEPDLTDDTTLHQLASIVLFGWSVKILVSAYACGAIGTAIYGCFYVLMSFVMFVTTGMRLHPSLEAADIEGADDTRHNLFSRLASVLPRWPSVMPRFFTTRIFTIFMNCKCLSRVSHVF